MVDYKKMYALMCKAASDSLDILSQNTDTNSINSVRFLLEQAMIQAKNIYIVTAKGDCKVEGQNE